MTLSNTSKQQEISQFITFLFIGLVCMTTGALLLPYISEALGISDLKTFMSELSETSSAADRQRIKVIQIVNHLFTFSVPSIVFVILIHKNKAFQFLKLNKFPNTQMLLMGSMLIGAGFLVAQALLKLNQLIYLPSGAAELEAKASSMTNVFLVMNTPSEFILTFLAIAILPAIGEELMFRGIIQRYLYKYNRHAAIIITGFLFSAFHLQFQGFLPRFFLGVVLGYLYYWSGSLWLPIIAHFINNGVQVLIVYFYKMKGGEMDATQAQDLPWLGVAMATIVTVGIFYWFEKRKEVALE